MYNFSRTIHRKDPVGSILNIRNKFLFSGFMGNKLRGLRDLFVPHSDSFSMNPEKSHSFLKYRRMSEYRSIP